MSEKDSKKRSEEKIPQPLNADKKIELTDEELEQVVGGQQKGMGKNPQELLPELDPDPCIKNENYIKPVIGEYFDKLK